VTGPVIGGLLLDRFWFGAIFLINVPVAALGFVLIILVLPESRGPVRSGGGDVPGALEVRGHYGLPPSGAQRKSPCPVGRNCLIRMLVVPAVGTDAGRRPPP
jgi:MFS family permease